MKFVEELASNIRDARKAAGMTQSDLAQMIGCTPNCVSLYETARRMPNLRTMSMMSNALGASLEALIPSEPYDMPADENQTDIFDLIEE